MSISPGIKRLLYWSECAKTNEKREINFEKLIFYFYCVAFQIKYDHFSFTIEYYCQVWIMDVYGMRKGV